MSLFDPVRSPGAAREYDSGKTKIERSASAKKGEGEAKERDFKQFGTARSGGRRDAERTRERSLEEHSLGGPVWRRVRGEGDGAQWWRATANEARAARREGLRINCETVTGSAA